MTRARRCWGGHRPSSRTIRRLPSGSSCSRGGRVAAIRRREFDHLTFTYLLRYVEDPAATLCELARVVQPGGRVASLEFCAPNRARALARGGCTPVGLPALGRLISRDWYEVGPVPGTQHQARPALSAGAPAGAVGRRGSAASGEGDEPRRRRRDLGAPCWRLAASGTRPRLLRPAPGGWRDLVTLLHPPYTPGTSPTWRSARRRRPRSTWTGCWPRSAPSSSRWRGRPRTRRAHGRPLGTQLSDRSLIALASIWLGGASGSASPASSSSRPPWRRSCRWAASWCVAYNLELLGGRFHTDFWFAAAWGAFPALTGWLVNVFCCSFRCGRRLPRAPQSSLVSGSVPLSGGCPRRCGESLRRRTDAARSGESSGFPTGRAGSWTARASLRHLTARCGHSPSRSHCSRSPPLRFVCRPTTSRVSRLRWRCSRCVSLPRRQARSE